MSSNFPVWADIEIRFRDTDAMNHVNNAVYASYAEVARQAYWKRVDPTLAYEHVPFILARIEIDFRSPALVGETLRAFIRMSWIGRRSFGTDYEIRERDTERLIVEAKSVQVTYDYEQNAAIPFPDELRKTFERIEGHALPGKPVG